MDSGRIGQRTMIASGKILKSTLFEHPVRTQCRDVAQPGRALAWGARGRQFKSARPDQFLSLRLVPSQSGMDCKLPIASAPRLLREAKRSAITRKCEGSCASSDRLTGSLAQNARDFGSRLPLPSLRSDRSRLPNASICPSRPIYTTHLGGFSPGGNCKEGSIDARIFTSAKRLHFFVTKADIVLCVLAGNGSVSSY